MEWSYRREFTAYQREMWREAKINLWTFGIGGAVWCAMIVYCVSKIVLGD